MSKTVRYYIDVDEKGAVRGTNAVEGGLQKIEKQSEKTGASTIALGNILAQAASQMASKLAAVVSQSQELFARQEQAEQKVEAVIKATQGAAGFSVGELKKYASELQSYTTIGDEAFLESMSTLLTFKSVTGDVFKEAISLSADTASIFGSLESATLQIGKALEDPTTGMTALRRIGVMFTQTQQEQIKHFQDTNDLASAQAIILGNLEGQLGGVARELAQTDTGKWQQFLNDMGDSQEELGRVIVALKVEFIPVLQTLIGWFGEAVNWMLFMAENTGTTVDSMFASWEWLKDNVAVIFINMFQIAKNYITNLPEIIWNGIKAIFKLLDNLVEYNLTSIQNMIAGFKELGIAILAAITDPLNAKDKIEAAFQNLIQVGKDQISNVANLGKELGDTLRENMQDNAELLADGLIEYDNTAFTGVEFTTWAEFSRKRLEDGLKVTVPTPEMGDMDIYESFKAIGEAPFAEMLDFELPDLAELNFDNILKISDGTIATVNSQLATIDLMPDASINDLQSKLQTVRELHSAAQTDAERERLAIAQNGIELQLEARRSGLTEEQILWEDHLEFVRESLTTTVNVAMDLYNGLAGLIAVNSANELNLIEKEKNARLKAIDEALKKEGISEKQREALLARRADIEANYEEQTNNLKREQFEKEKAANVLMAIAQTAIAVTESLSRPFLAVAVGIAGALQVATIEAQANPYFYGGPILERLPNGMTSSGKKLISINETGDPEYIVNAASAKRHRAVLDAINYYPQLADQMFAPMQFAGGGGLDGINPMNHFNYSTLSSQNLDIPIIEQVQAELIGDAILEGFSKLKANFNLVAEGRELRAVEQATTKFEEANVVRF